MFEVLEKIYDVMTKKMSCGLHKMNNTYGLQHPSIYLYIYPNSHWLYLTVDVIELILIIVSSFLVSFAFYIFITTPIFHNHLMRLIYGIIVSYYAIMSSRVFSMIFMLRQASKMYLFTCVDFLDQIEFIRLSSMAIYLSSLLCIIMERFVALYLISSYEKHSHLWITVLGIAIQMFSGLVVYVLLVKGKPKVRILLYGYLDKVNLIFLSAYAILITIFGYIFFNIVQEINNKLYKTACSCDSYTLSHRYQLCENIRTSQILKRVSGLAPWANLILEVCIIINAFIENVVVRQLTIIVFNYVLVLYSIMFIVIVILETEQWKRRSIEILKKLQISLKKPISVEDTSSPLQHSGISTVNLRIDPELKTLNGNRMTFEVHEETDVYFQSLYELWNTNYERRFTQ
ncbi:hypothetical protein M3Y96_00950700 [Aphelenchoides besseyi]|nr:hypothetical protein M3Y96_00950700 [Aphelenchoides besseyi]